jgi:XrtN system VIT domain protein
MGEWNTRIANMQKTSNQSVLREDQALPIWVEVAQQIKKDWISERIIKSDLVYTTHKGFHWDIFPIGRVWRETKKHDPLVYLSSLVSKSSLSYDDRVRILQSVFADRHHANERLWSGDNLITSYIVSDVDIYPALRLAYVEKYLNVRNNVTAESWATKTQEAIYTFQLPEGSVVTSLSLWINGKEEKGILTSKQKAENAYKTIVGVERRDPSVVHWQEGNTITVRVFPCTPDEERKFKIGITCPLIEEDDEIIFKNIKFLGPSPNRARETFRIRFLGFSEQIDLPHHFEKTSNGYYVTEHLYDPDFEVSFKKLDIPSNHFSFDGNVYSMHPLVPSFEAIEFDQIFLDINNAWTRNELNAVEGLLSNYKVYTTVDNALVQSIDGRKLARRDG